jgi:7-cyano-7-deazaguanine reductase
MTLTTDKQHLVDAPLGKKSVNPQEYTPSLLFPIPRINNRNEIGISQPLPFAGVDIWNAYELSWLNTKGKPVVSAAEIIVPCESPCIVESKSLKLYFNSFNQSQFADAKEVQQIIENDLTKIIGSKVTIRLITRNEFSQQKASEFTGICLDDLDVRCDTYHRQTNYLRTTEAVVDETVYSHLIKSHCLVTNQPDFGSVSIHYRGRQIDHAGLLQYLISFRQDNDFAEQFAERLFVDIMQYCQPQELTVFAAYTRRGGIDINPFRSTFEQAPVRFRLAWQ